MTIDELIADLDLTSTQRYEMIEAFEESPDGFARIVKKADGANNRAAALISMVRKGEHTKIVQTGKGTKPEATTLDDLVSICLRSYNARIAKYPPNDERGWTDDDAIVYAVWVASTWNSRISQDDIERAFRVRIGKPWTSDQDPALGTGCPPELLANVLTKLSRIGVIVVEERKPPEPATTASDLAQRLLATLGA